MSTTATASAGTSVTVPEKPFAVALLETHGHRIKDLLPPGVSLDRVAATLRLEIMKNPKLAECTTTSLIMSLGRVFRWGLELGETAYLVPFTDRKKGITEATAIMGYSGMVELMIGSGAVRAVQAKAVHANDQFAYELGLNATLQHIPDSNPKTRGPITGAYCILRLGRGVDDVFDYMSIEEIEEIRAKSKQWSPQMIGPVCPDWYGVKTVIRRTSKLVPQNRRLARALSSLDEIDLELELEPGDQVATVSAPVQIERPRGPRPLSTDGMVGYDEPTPAAQRVPVAPGSVNDHAEADRGGPPARPLDYIDDSDLVD